MAIQELQVYGYRSFRKASWQPRKLNLLVGPNGSGKSNLLRLLELIHYTARGRLEKFIAKRGGVVPLLWDHRPGKFGWRVRIDPVDAGHSGTEDALTFELEMDQIRGGSAYQITKDTLGNWFKYDRQQEKSPYWIFERDATRAYVYDQQVHNLVRLDDQAVAFDYNESLLSQIADPRNRIPLHVKRKLEAWRIHHDVHVDRESAMRQPATTQHSTLVDADGGNLQTVLHTLYTGDRDFRTLIDEGMRAGFGDEYESLTFPPAAAQQIQLAVQWRSSTNPHVGSDLSDGTLRFLYLLAVLANPTPATLIAIDEPEVGLHPSMLPIVAEYATAAAEKTQVVLTTHSPEFLDAFSEASPHVTVCHWEDGESHLFPLDPDALSTWLDKYRLGHLFTQGDLEELTLRPVEKMDDTEEWLKELPPEDAAMTDSPSGQGEIAGE